jgi:hypothetical protein
VLENISMFFLKTLLKNSTVLVHIESREQ